MSDLIHGGKARWSVDTHGVVEKRSFYERMLAIGYTPSAIAGIDLLTDDGMPLEDAAGYMIASQRGGGDPEADARHLVELRKAFRGAT